MKLDIAYLKHMYLSVGLERDQCTLIDFIRIKGLNYRLIKYKQQPNKCVAGNVAVKPDPYWSFKLILLLIVIFK